MASGALPARVALVAALALGAVAVGGGLALRVRLGGVVAAAAHELGTPLATIKLASSELADELEDRPELRDDAVLIREQAERCGAILVSMGRAGKDDKLMLAAPLCALIREAAEVEEDIESDKENELAEDDDAY